MSRSELLFIDDSIWVLQTLTGIAAYDFDFRPVFACRTPWRRPAPLNAVARLGPIVEYGELWRVASGQGIKLIHTPDEHCRASLLSEWYPLLSDLTPRSRVFANSPSVDEVEAEFGWPLFMKGDRQTSRHRRALSIVSGRDEFIVAVQSAGRDSILRWQPLAFREFVPLRRVEDELPERIPSSFEFRTFWWKGVLVGTGRYWWEGARYEWSEQEQASGLAVAREAARRVNVPFLAVDIAQTLDGRWIVIDCNDGQEAGYAGASPIGIWQRIITLERQAAEHGALISCISPPPSGGGVSSASAP